MLTVATTPPPRPRSSFRTLCLTICSAGRRETRALKLAKFLHISAAP